MTGPVGAVVAAERNMQLGCSSCVGQCGCELLSGGAQRVLHSDVEPHPDVKAGKALHQRRLVDLGDRRTVTTYGGKGMRVGGDDVECQQSAASAAPDREPSRGIA